MFLEKNLNASRDLLSIPHRGIFVLFFKEKSERI